MKPTKSKEEYPILEPNLQISFYFKLQRIKEFYLHDALKASIEKLRIKNIDQQLSKYVNTSHLNKVASFGLRGEIFFPVPYVIESNPFLLGYYRLLFGFSQKEFYNKGPFGKFKKLEDQGTLTATTKNSVETLCISLIKTAQIIVESIDDISLSIVHDLQLLTVGPQLRGGENTRLGQDAHKEVYNIIKTITSGYLKETTPKTLILENESGRIVLIEFASDPDIRITEKLPSRTRSVVSIEIKGGTDASNIHNRLGEAEKSHQKAKKLGFFEFWTIIRVPLDEKLAKRESPTTSHFFQLDGLANPNSTEYSNFRELLVSLIGIKA
jgi:hypothetical protein